MVPLRAVALACAAVAVCVWFLARRQPLAPAPVAAQVNEISTPIAQQAPVASAKAPLKITDPPESAQAPQEKSPRLSWDNSTGIPEQRVRLELSETDVDELENALTSLQRLAYTVPIREGWELRLKREAPVLARLGLRDGDRITEASLGGDSPSPLARRVRTVLDELAR